MQAKAGRHAAAQAPERLHTILQSIPRAAPAVHLLLPLGAGEVSRGGAALEAMQRAML